MEDGIKLEEKMLKSITVMRKGITTIYYLLL